MVYGQYLAGIPSTSALLLPMIQGIARARNLEMYTCKFKEGQLPKRWVQRLTQAMGLTLRKSQTDRFKSTPEKSAQAARILLLRLTFVCKVFGVPPQLIFNADETALRLLSVRNRGLGPKGGSHQVSFRGADDKRQYTCLPIISAAGALCMPVQLIWGGGTQNCTPSLEVRTEYSHSLYHDFSPSHWTTLDTFKRAVRALFKDHVSPTIAKLGLDTENQKWVFLIDLFSVHRSVDFREWLKEEFPSCICLYIPPNETASTQPLDLYFNFKLKASVSRQVASWMGHEVCKQLQAGTTPDQVIETKKTSNIYKTIKTCNFSVPPNLVLAVLSYFSLVLATLSSRSCPRILVPSVLSSQPCVLSALRPLSFAFFQSCPRNLVLSVLSSQSCPRSLVFSVLCSQSCPRSLALSISSPQSFVSTLSSQSCFLILVFKPRLPSLVFSVRDSLLPR